MTGNYSEFSEQWAEQLAAFIEQNLRLVLGLMLLWGVLLLFFCILCVVANWRMFEKAGERGWLCLIPFLSGHVAFKIAWHPFFFWFNAALLFGSEILNAMIVEGGVNMPYVILAALALSIASIIISVTHSFKLSRAFGHGVGFALGLVFLPYIFIPILGLGRSVYQGKIR